MKLFDEVFYFGLVKKVYGFCQKRYLYVGNKTKWGRVRGRAKNQLSIRAIVKINDGPMIDVHLESFNLWIGGYATQAKVDKRAKQLEREFLDKKVKMRLDPKNNKWLLLRVIE